MRGLERGQRPALLTLECQRGVVEPELAGRAGLSEQAAQRAIIAKIAILATLCRSVGVPVFHNLLVHRPDFAGSGRNAPLLGANYKRRSMLAGTPEVELVEPLAGHASDFEVARLTGVTPFYGTALEIMLRNCAVTTVIITGVSTNLGVPGAGIEAINRGFNVVFAQDCIAGVWAEAHDFHVQHTLPILGTVSDSITIAAALLASAASDPSTQH